MLKLSAQPEKIETGGSGEAACRQFQFFSGWADSFNILCQYHGFMKLPEKFQSFQKTCHKTCPFLLSVSVKLCDNKIKKWNQFLYETVLLLDFRHEANGKESTSLQQTFNFTLYLDKFQNKSQ